ncbi:dihydroflavonol-4-reductase [Strigomonas culicis]|uniref:Dihydroflavonol-4-reductase n=1 Tax=Strigomonas culicis TaxID=28005 RepID=S9UU78_9TRYP|nr:dihydroflavonol-4-reductase [Strigomonas culicis]|eukprot:EPY32374.1 dihydroflavonol-4-reductase [Strigomonas culicis]
MFRVFSGSCLSLEDMDTIYRPNLVERPHVLGPGMDFFTEDGEPLRPQPGIETLQKVFSRSALDLNAMNSDAFSDSEQQETNSPLAAQRTLPVSTILNHLASETEKERTRLAKSKIVVLVIGDYTYISSHVVAKLLDMGFTVRVTLSDTTKPQLMDTFYTSEATNRISITQLDMTSSSALRDVIRGCRYIIHCGCPSSVSKKKGPVTYHVEAVRALFDGIRLAGKSTVKRVVLTGAATSVFNVNDPEPPSGMFDESNWNNAAANETVALAKLAFENEAWRIRTMLGMVELVVLLPSVTIGPSCTEETSEAMLMIQNLATAPRYFPFCPDVSYNFVDVRDVAEALVRALESTEVNQQRVIISNQCLSLLEMARIIKKLYPHLTPPTRIANTFMTLLVGTTQSSDGLSKNVKSWWRSLGVKRRLDNRRAVDELGLHFTPIEETISACVDQMIRGGEVPTRTRAPRHPLH